MKTIAIASVKATQVGKSQYQGRSIPVIKGRQLTNDQMITLFPGTVPASIPALDYWQKQAFNYIAFSPISSANKEECLPHLRMDQMLQFLLGDKLK